jgi:hypothetical protein
LGSEWHLWPGWLVSWRPCQGIQENDALWDCLSTDQGQENSSARLYGAQIPALSEDSIASAQHYVDTWSQNDRFVCCGDNSEGIRKARSWRYWPWTGIWLELLQDCSSVRSAMHVSTSFASRPQIAAHNLGHSCVLSMPEVSKWGQSLRSSGWFGHYSRVPKTFAKSVAFLSVCYSFRVLFSVDEASSQYQKILSHTLQWPNNVSAAEEGVTKLATPDHLARSSILKTWWSQDDQTHTLRKRVSCPGRWNRAIDDCENQSWILIFIETAIQFATQNHAVWSNVSILSLITLGDIDIWKIWKLSGFGNIHHSFSPFSMISIVIIWTDRHRSWSMHTIWSTLIPGSLYSCSQKVVRS